MPKYGLWTLCVDEIPEAERINGRLLGANTLGIEVTTPHFAERCGRGNIDPQHGTMPNSHSSAVEEATTHPLPPFGTKLVTIRPDADSLAAAAVLRLRADGVRTSEMDLKLIKWIGAVDRDGFKVAAAKHKNLMPKEMERYFAIVTIATNSGGHWPEIEDQLLAIEGILTRRTEFDEIQTLASLLPRSNDFGRFEATIIDGVAFIVAPGRLRYARSWAGGVYPVSAIFDPENFAVGRLTQQRWSVICQTGCFDRVGFETAINEAEAAVRNVSVQHLRQTGGLWGGPQHIVSSPQGSGHDSQLSKDAILAIVSKHVLKGDHLSRRSSRNLPAWQAA